MCRWQVLARRSKLMRVRRHPQVLDIGKSEAAGFVKNGLRDATPDLQLVVATEAGEGARVVRTSTQGEVAQGGQGRPLGRPDGKP